MPFKVITSSEYFLEDELNDFEKNHIIKKFTSHYDESAKQNVIVIEWVDKRGERAEKLNEILSEYTPSMVTCIDKMFEHSFKKQWFETYWLIDIHNTILEPNYKKQQHQMKFYPYAKEVLQILSNRKDIKLIMFTSSYPEEIDFYSKEFEKFNIHFDYINENPEIDSTKGNFGFYEKKYYFNILIDDKAGFNSKMDWFPIYELLQSYQKNNYLPDSTWNTKF